MADFLRLVVFFFACKAFIFNALQLFSIFSSFLLLTLAGYWHSSPVATRHANHQPPINMKTRQPFPLPKRADIDDAFVALHRSDMPHREKQVLLVLIERAKRESDRKAKAR